MQTKLTLTLDADAIRQAKHYAKDHHTSLSRMVQGFFMGIAREGSEIQLTGGLPMERLQKQLID